MRIKHLAQLTGVIFLLWSATTMGQNAPSRVLYLSGVHTLDGYLYKPKGSGPFPAVVYLQPSMNQPKANPQPAFKLAEIFTSQGYAFFVPGRHQIGSEEASGQGQKKNDGKLFLAHEKQAANFAAAVSWLKSQSFINETRITLFGEAAGGVSALFMTDQDLGLNGIILASPGTQFLQTGHEAPARLKQAVADAKAPIFLIQTQSDPNLLPSEILGPEIAKKGRPSHVKVYPRFGQRTNDSQKFISDGYAIWQEDVFAFLQRISEPTVTLRQTN